MKKGASKKKRSSNDGFQGYSDILVSDQPSESEPAPPKKDPLYIFLQTYHFSSLAQAGGILPDSNQIANSNILMWSNEQLCQLRSELLALSSIIDSYDTKIQNIYRTVLQEVIEEKTLNNNDTILRVYHMNDPIEEKTAESFNSDLFIPSRSPSIDSSIRTRERSGAAPRHRTDETRSLLSRPTRQGNNSSSNTKSTLSADSLWENTELFLLPIEHPNQFLSLLAPEKIFFSPQVLHQPFGQHYSLTLPRTPEFASDSLKSKLIMPPSPFEASADNSAHLHSRLLAAIVPVQVCETALQDGTIEENILPNLREGPQFIARLKSGSIHTQQHQMKRVDGIQTPEGLGISLYGQLSFEQKLKLELSSIGFNEESQGISDVSCPVAKGIAYLEGKQKDVLNHSNQMKLVVSDYVKKNRSLFEENVKVHKTWVNALNRYLEDVKKQQQLKKKKKHIKAEEE